MSRTYRRDVSRAGNHPSGHRVKRGTDRRVFSRTASVKHVANLMRYGGNPERGGIRL